MSAEPFPLADLTFEIASKSERAQIIGIIDIVASEKVHLQTGRYIPTPNWEKMLEEGVNLKAGLALFVVKYKKEIIGFGRLTPDDELGRMCGNVGIVLLEPYRSKGIGTTLLGVLIKFAAYLGFSSLTADILAGNIISLRLFGHYGFALSSSRKIFLSHLGQDGQECRYVMSLPRREIYAAASNT
jgi:RimJ/RimL family protein N-acetyltransferase